MDLHRPSGILAAPPLAGVSVKPPFSPHPRASPERRPAALPAALAFLTVHGVSPAVLLTAAVEARRQSHRAGGRRACERNDPGAFLLSVSSASSWRRLYRRRDSARRRRALSACGSCGPRAARRRRWLPLARRAARSVAYPSLGKGARRRALGRAPCDHDAFAFVELGGRGGDRVDPPRGKPRPRQPRSESFRERTP